MTREDIGYGPARPYEYDVGPEMREPREKRRPGGARRPEPIPEGAGPYHRRLLRRSVPDLWIQADVERALFHDTWVNADRITVRVDHGVVTLIGTLPDAEEIDRALRDARSVPGVRRIRDHLETEP